MPSLPAAVSWLLSQRAAPRRPGVWSAQDAADLAGVPADRALAYLRRVEVAGAVVRLPDGSFTAGPRRAVAAWRSSRGKATSEGGNSAEYRRAKALREKIQARIANHGGVEEVQGGDGSGGNLTSPTRSDPIKLDQTRSGEDFEPMMTTITVACKQLSLSRPTIHRRIRDGSIQSVLIGNRRRIPITEIERIKREGLTRGKA